MFGFRKKEEELELALMDLKFNEEILNKIQASLFCGEKLDSETIENSFLELQVVRDNIEEYFNSNNRPNEIRRDFLDVGNYLKRELIYFGMIILLCLVLGPYAFILAFFLGMFKFNKDKENSKLDILISDKNESMSELFDLMMKRVINYENVLKIKQSRLRIAEDSDNKSENMLILANLYLDLYLNNDLSLFDIPLDVQNVLLVMLQQEFNSSQSLEELLKLVKEKRTKEIMVRERTNLFRR